MNHIDSLIKHPHKLGRFIGYPELSEIHSEWIKHLWQSKSDSALQAHRNSYKTTSVIIVGCIWHLLQYPEHRILILREETTNAEKTLATIAELYLTDPVKYLYKQLFNIERIKSENWSTKSITLTTKRQPTPEGNIEAKGMNSSLTGSHYEIICVDDIITENDRYSKAKREQSKRKIFELSNIKVAGGKIQASGTPWHKDDAHQFLPKPLVYSVTDEVWRIKKFTPEVAAEIKSKMPLSLWAANYELKHISDEDRIFTDPVYEEFPDDIKLIGVLDSAFGGGNNTAFAVGGKVGNFIYLTGRTWDKSVSNLHDDIVRYAEHILCGTMYVEDNADKGATTQALKKLRPGLVIGYPESGNKHKKIIGFLHANWQNVRFLPGTQKEFIYNILEYQEGVGVDDEADACASLIRFLLRGKSKPSIRSVII